MRTGWGWGCLSCYKPARADGRLLKSCLGAPGQVLPWGRQAAAVPGPKPGLQGWWLELGRNSLPQPRVQAWPQHAALANLCCLGPCTFRAPTPSAPPPGSPRPLSPSPPPTSCPLSPKWRDSLSLERGGGGLEGAWWGRGGGAGVRG